MAQTPDDDEFGLDSADEAELLAAQENAKSQADRESSVSSLFAQMQSIFTRPADVDHDQEARDALRQLTRQLLQRLETPLPPVSQAKRKTDTEQSEIEYPVLPKRQRKEEDALLSTSQSLTVATQVLRTRFGMQAFRLKQAQAITRLLEGGSCVVVFPTGGGKSLCYQAPALAFAEMDKLESIRQGLAETGITLVVSPLIALMKDQVDALKRRGISAAVLDSTKTKEEYMATVEAMRNGTLDILYCAPERLNNEGFVASIARVRGGVRLLAVDEAHCISEWGHAFRPDYLKVARFSREIEAERVVCLTATATPKVAQDVCKAFEIPEEKGLFRTTTYRPNLSLQARSFNTKQESYPHLTHLLKEHPGPTIVYVTLQKHTEELARQLRSSGFKARHFHAGLETEEKNEVQDMFMRANDLIIVATIAFGMGIDKANIRNVVHYDIPRSLEGYSQEIGRAGRDGKDSHCMLFLCAEDLHLRESFARGDLPSKQSVVSLLSEIFSSRPCDTGHGWGLEASLYHQAKDHDIKQTVLKNIYAQLELRFGLLRETTPKYGSYSYKSLRPTTNDTSPAAKAIHTAATSKQKSRKTVNALVHLDVDAMARNSGLGRAEIVSKLQEWNDRGLIDLRTKEVINIYRITRAFPPPAAEQKTMLEELYTELEAREKQDLDRMEEVNDLITGQGCFSRRLAEHFGDSLPDEKEECGHCTWCKTHQPVNLIISPPPVFDQKRFKQVLIAVPERDDARYIARVAFGIGSPRATANKLSKNAVFGSMEDHDFQTLLDAATRACSK